MLEKVLAVHFAKWKQVYYVFYADPLYVSSRPPPTVQPGAGGCFLSSSWTPPIRPPSCPWPHSKTAWDTSAWSWSTSLRVRSHGSAGLWPQSAQSQILWRHEIKDLHHISPVLDCESWKDCLKSHSSRWNHLVSSRKIVIFLLNTVQLFKNIAVWVFISFSHHFLPGNERFQSSFFVLSAAARATGLTKDASYLGPFKVVNFYLWFDSFFQ